MAKDTPDRGHPTREKPKQLRKRLRKAEAKLEVAEMSLESAELRVRALTIITDEIRAQLEAAERPSATAGSDEAGMKTQADTRRPSGSADA